MIGLSAAISRRPPWSTLDACQYYKDRENQVFRREGKRTDIVGNEKTVRHLVGVVHQLHADTGQREKKQFFR